MKKTLTNTEWFNSPYLTEYKPNAEDIGNVERIGQWYEDNESKVTPETIHMWRLLAIESYNQALRFMEKYNVYAEPVSGQPYDNHHEMFADIKQGILLVSTENVDHPLMNQYDIFYERVWHDLTHYEISTGFGFAGEKAAYLAQCQQTLAYSENNYYLISHALYVDIVGQTANGLLHKRFPIQKVF